MKKILAILLAVAMLLTCMVGCSNNTSSSSSSASSSESKSEESKEESSEATSEESTEPTSDAAWDTSKEDEIVVSVINMYYTSGWKYMAEEYMKLHPETKVTIDVVADNDSYSQKMTTWLSGDDYSDAADIVHINFAASVLGGIGVMYAKNMCYDMTTLLDTANPYADGATVRSYLDEGDIGQYTDAAGVYALPFDHVGVAVMYNKTLLEANGMDVPATQEEWLEQCATLKANGMETPIAASSEANWYITSLADAAMRDKISEYMIQPEDGAYDAATMSANDGFVWNEDDWTCDGNVVMSGERMAMYKMENKFTDPMSISVWTEFQKLGQYFTPNYTQANSSDVLTSFEMQNSAFLLSGSWNVGALNSDIAEMGDAGFEWGTMGFPSFATVPDGWAFGAIRSLYAMGNTMGIILTGDEDHLARVLDFYMYVYSPSGCQSMYEQTLNNGYWVQGPCAIKGVTLDENLNMKLEGFVQEGTQKGDMGGFVGTNYLSADANAWVDALNSLLTGEIDATEFCTIISPISLRSVQDSIDKNGYDLDPSTKDEIKA